MPRVPSSLTRVCVSETRILDNPARLFLTEEDGLKELPSRILELRGFGCLVPNWATLSGLTELQVLHLPYSTMTDIGADTVIPQLSALREVVLRGTTVANKTLVGLSALDHLAILDVSETLVTASCLAGFLNTKCRLTLRELIIGHRSDWSSAQALAVREQALVNLRPDARCL
jgi:hypothetical protein